MAAKKSVTSLYQDIEYTVLSFAKDEQNWLSFLKTAAWNYKYSFQDQLLIYAQRPDARACAEIQDWNNKLGRWVNAGAKGIALIDDRGNKPKLRHVFDVSDTHSLKKRPFFLWNIKERYTNDVLETLESNFGYLQNNSSLVDAVISAADNACADNGQDYLDDLMGCREGSFLEKLDKENTEVLFGQALRNSVAYTALIRCGYDADTYFQLEDFAGVVNFGTLETASRLGAAASDISEMMLRQIEITVKTIQKEERKRSFTNYRDKVLNEDERIDEHGTELQTAGRLPDTRPGAAGGEGEHRQIWDASENIHEKSQERDVREPDPFRQITQPSGGDRPDGAGADRVDSVAASGEAPGPGQTNRSNGLGGPHEQSQAPGGGNGTGGTGIQLEWFDRETEDRSLPFFSSNYINEILRTTPYLQATKQEIEAFFILHEDEKERIGYLKSIFNHNITDLTIEDDHQVGYKTYKNVLHLWEGTYAEKTSQGYYHWGVIAGHIESMILFREFNEEPSFLTEQQQINLIEQAEQNKGSAFYMPQEAIDRLLQGGGSYESGKYRIYLHFKKKLSAKENISYLKNTYGTGGRSPAFTGTHIHEWHDSKGITLSEGYEKKITLTWAKVQKRIGELIAADRYLNRKEKEYLPLFEQKERECLQQQEEAAYAREILNREPEPADEPEPTRDNVHYAFSLGDRVFIGTDEYEVFSFENGTVILNDVRYPLLQKEFEQGGFVKLLQDNPINDHLISYEEPAQENADIFIVHADDSDVPEWMSKDGDVKIIRASNTVTIESADDGEKTYVEMEVELPGESNPGRDIVEDQPVPKIKQPKYNYSIKDDNLGHGGAKTKYGWNVTAIRMLNQLEQENRMATPAEQEVLSRYVGWGGLAQVFEEKNTQWEKEFAELKQLLSPEEYTSARESVLNAHYTSPTVIKAIYQAIENMGFKTGNILEPACGVGNFFGLVPDSMRSSKLYGIELDSITGRIAKQLYQDANIAVQGFENTDLPDSFFDLAIGNVPFGSYGVLDQRYDKHNFYIHDYFFAKTLDKVRPGGIIAFVTSKGTMDKQNPAVRRYIAQRAELIGAVRLPNNAFLDNAGTEVTADILFLQKRDRVIDVDPEWVHLYQTDDGIPVNQYFADHPEMMLGTMTYDNRMYGSTSNSTCTPREGVNLSDALQDAIRNIQAEITEYELDDMGEEVHNTSIPADPSVRNYSFCMVDGEIYYRENSRMNRIETSVTARGRIKGMIEIRDCVRLLIQYQMDDYSDEVIQEQQGKLNRLYDGFTAQYGLLNSRGNNMAFSDDSSYCLLCSLEVLDEEGELKSKADMFTKRTIRQRNVITRVDTATEALAISIAEKARVDIGYIESLTGLSEEQIIKDLEGIIFRNPITTNDGVIRYETADEYLSGNVRDKLSLARQFAEMQPELYSANVKALEAAQPKDLTASEIDVRLGSTWLPADVVNDFLFELLETPLMYRKNIEVRYSELTAEWNIKGKREDRSDNIKAKVTFGTDRINAYKIIEDTLNLRDVRIFDTVYEDGKEVRVFNKKETQIAQQKQDLIKDAFQGWVWKDPKRRERLTRLYNDRFNSIRPREYDGSHIRFPGMNPEITLRTHQNNGAARIIYGGNTLLAHCVGAGKTYTMVAAAMESKRLGLCNKSMFVVPNHLTEQWAGDFLQLYPSANILVATKKDFETKNRKKFCARIATGDYNAVIVGHSQFEKIPVSIELQKKQLEYQIEAVTSGIRQLKEEDGERYAIKQLEKTRKNLKIKLEKLVNSKKKDNVVTFEELGVDRLFVDEADTYKNLFLYTKMRNVGGLAQTEAQKSLDMFIKCRYMDELTGGKGIIFATGTPISNSIAEMYTMQRYLQYEALRRCRLEHFDCWASTFGETVTSVELAPTGTGYRAKTRFARFFNLPELMNLFREVADIQTADMLKLPVPEVEYRNISVKPSEFQVEMVKDAGVRAERVRNKEVEPNEDNYLKITNDGKKVALDQRLINSDLPDFEGSKVNECVRQIFDFWKVHKEKKLTQLVFCDMSTPKKDGSFNLYDDMRQKLIDLGVPASEIGFIHDANTEIRKKEMFAKTRSGQIRILFGSTFKMGVRP
jgi:N12 class adenine-specific DNA methylase